MVEYAENFYSCLGKTMDIRYLSRNGAIDSLNELARSQTSALERLRKQLEPFNNAMETARSQSESLQNIAQSSNIAELTRSRVGEFSKAIEAAERIRKSVIEPAERMAEQLANFRPHIMESFSKTADAIKAVQESVLVPSQHMVGQIAAMRPTLDKTSFEASRIPEPIHLNAVEPVQPRVTAAAEVLGRINDEFERRKADVAGTEKQVQIKVTPPDGRPILAMTLTAEGENMIIISGYDMRSLADSTSQEKRTVTVGAAAFQVEFFTIDLPPTKPELRLVE